MKASICLINSAYMNHLHFTQYIAIRIERSIVITEKPYYTIGINIVFNNYLTLLIFYMDRF